ncbi:unnamed protein product [Ilex paraguariensis]|uniref:Uncharacterized protein n=1 Tax=Ilex paraguariensis TaxID=185542 RepID=A0ABC8RSX5_9AQUA
MKRVIKKSLSDKQKVVGGQPKVARGWLRGDRDIAEGQPKRRQRAVGTSQKVVGGLLGQAKTSSKGDRKVIN